MPTRKRASRPPKRPDPPELPGRTAEPSPPRAVSVRERDTGIEIPLYVRPGARADQVAGCTEGALRIQVRAPASEGQANRAACRALAQALGIAPSRVTLLSGTRSRHKRAQIRGPGRKLRDAIETLARADDD